MASMGAGTESPGAERSALRMAEREAKPLLRVRMLGDFSVLFGDTELMDLRQSSAQFGRLLQILLFHRNTGVDARDVREYLFEERDIEDASHALRNVVYNAKKRLISYGLPGEELIRAEKKRYFWTDAVDVELDTERMQALSALAEKEQDADVRLAMLEEAASLYRGGFLDRMSAAPWVAEQASVFQQLYRACIGKAFDILRQKQDYRRMRDMAESAASVDPFAEWEVRQVEALVALGRYEEAQKLCDSTVDLYIREHGLRTSAYVRELVNRLNSEMIHQYEALDEIQSKLMEPAAAERGGYVCSYPVFQEVYRTVARMMERHGDMVYLMLCTVVDSNGNPMKEGARLDKLSERLLHAIVQSVRHSDTVTRFGKGQYLVLLANTTAENCGIVQKRITRNFTEGRQRISVEYLINSVAGDSLGRQNGSRG